MARDFDATVFQYATPGAMADAAKETSWGSRDWDSRNSWLGGESKAEAYRMARAGNPSLVGSAQAILDRMEADIVTTQRERVPSVCGAFPVVPDFLAGRPDCMRRHVVDLSDASPVRVVVDLTSSAGVSADALQRKGVACLALTMRLAERRPVELWAGCAIGAGSKTAGNVLAYCTLPTAPLDVSVCCHVLTSTAWVRGLAYGIGMGNGATGSWAFGTFPTPGSDAEKSYIEQSRGFLRLNPQDVFVPPAFLTANLDDSAAWVMAQLAAFHIETD